MSTQKFEYSISEELFQAIEQEFDGKTIAQRYLQSKDATIFETYGANWMRRTYELSIKPEYLDHTYEMIKQAAKKTGQLLFPHEAQRFIEIAYLSVHLMSGVNIYIANAQELGYKVQDGKCSIYEALKEGLSSSELQALPCKVACLTALQTLFKLLDMSIDISMPSKMPKDGFCLFCARKK